MLKIYSGFKRIITPDSQIIKVKVGWFLMDKYNDKNQNNQNKNDKNRNGQNRNDQNRKDQNKKNDNNNR